MTDFYQFFYQQPSEALDEPPDDGAAGWANSTPPRELAKPHPEGCRVRNLTFRIPTRGI
jgi:hypothetical protein